MPSKDEIRAAREAKLEALQERLSVAVEELTTSEDWRRAMTFAARFRSRSFNNTLLIWLQHGAAYKAGQVPEPTPTLVAGFRQWRSHGRQVMKGQPGYMIQAPVTARFASATPRDRSSWRRLARGEQPRTGEVARVRMVGVKPAYVWDVAQTSGEPLPALPRPKLLEGAAPPGLWDGLARLVRDAGFRLEFVPHTELPGGANGVTRFDVRVMAVRQELDPAAQVKTLAHELAHVMMHDPDAGRTHQGIGEVEAESVALMVGAAHRLDTSSYTIPYVSSWASLVDGKSPAEVIQAVGERVRATAVGILDSLSTTQIASGVPLARDAIGSDPEPSVRTSTSADPPCIDL